MERNPNDIGINTETPSAAGGSVATPYPEGSRPGAFQCRVCGQVFTNQSDLTVHLRRHEVSKITDEQNEKEKPAGVA